MNICAAYQYIPEIERYIRTIKERLWAFATSIPFERYSPRLIVEIVYICMFWLNSFPHHEGIHTTMSPRTIMKGQKLNYGKLFRVEFGTHV